MKASTIPSIDLSDQQTVEILSELLKTNYGISDDLMQDVHLSTLRKWRMEDRNNAQQKYVIMLKRIIKGKAKVEDFQQEEKPNDRF